MKRRTFLLAVAVVPTALHACTGGSDDVVAAGELSDRTFEITRTDAEWRKMLTPDQFHVLRESGTERPGSSPLNDEHRAGVFHCAGCDLPVYSSDSKFDSGTGWPSFTAALPDAVGASIDRSLFAVRTEVHCRRCGGHLGHVFDDGPPPTGKRHCLNGAALRCASDRTEPES